MCNVNIFVYIINVLSVNFGGFCVRNLCYREMNSRGRVFISIFEKEIFFFEFVDDVFNLYIINK